jgi:hypothetical protein
MFRFRIKGWGEPVRYKFSILKIFEPKVGLEVLYRILSI